MVMVTEFIYNVNTKSIPESFVLSPILTLGEEHREHVVTRGFLKLCSEFKPALSQNLCRIEIVKKVKLGYN